MSCDGLEGGEECAEECEEETGHGEVVVAVCGESDASDDWEQRDEFRDGDGGVGGCERDIGEGDDEDGC